MSFLTSVKQRVVQSKIASAESLVACTVNEVDSLEIAIGFQLPEAYREFLLWTGHSAGDFLRGLNMFYDELIAMQSEARILLLQSGVNVKLPDHAFVFFMHQGYQFHFFLTDDGPDPPIYFFIEPEVPYLKSPETILWERISVSFSSFLMDEVKNHEDIQELIGRGKNKLK